MTKRTERPRRYRCTCLALAVSALLVANVALAATETGRCLAVDVGDHAPFLLPDGRSVPANSSLQICYRSAYSPVAALHEIALNGKSVGLILSESRVLDPDDPRDAQALRRHQEMLARATGEPLGSNEIGNRPYLVLVRNSDQKLELLSYHRPLGDDRLSSHLLTPPRPRVTSHWLTQNNRRGKGRDTSKGEITESLLPEHQDTVILLAASR